MVSERIQRQIDRLLDQAEEAMGRLDWEVVRQRSQAVLSLQSDHGDAQTYLEAAAKALDGPEPAAAPISDHTPTKTVAVPTSFANGRYQVKDFLGEGGKKRVYKARPSPCGEPSVRPLWTTSLLNASIPPWSASGYSTR